MVNMRAKIAVGPLLLLQLLGNNCTNTGSPELRQPVRDFARKKDSEEKCLHFRQNMSLKARKNLRPSSQMFGPGPFAGSLSESLTSGNGFSD